MHNREKWKNISKDIDTFLASPNVVNVSVAIIRLNTYLSSLIKGFIIWNYKLHVFPASKEISLELYFPHDKTSYTKKIKCSFDESEKEYGTFEHDSLQKAYEYAMSVI